MILRTTNWGFPFMLSNILPKYSPTSPTTTNIELDKNKLVVINIKYPVGSPYLLNLSYINKPIIPVPTRNPNKPIKKATLKGTIEKLVKAFSHKDKSRSKV